MLDISAKKEELQRQLDEQIASIHAQRSSLDEAERELRYRFDLKMSVLDELDAENMTIRDRILLSIKEPKTSEKVATELGTDRRNIQKELSYFVRVKKAEIVGGNRQSGYLYKALPPRKPEEDRASASTTESVQLPKLTKLVPRDQMKKHILKICEQPHSNKQIAKLLERSSGTSIKIIQELIQEGKLKASKEGASVLYTTLSM